MFNSDVFKTWSLVLQLGISMIVPILLLVSVGYLIKNHFEYDFMLLLVILGVLVGVRNVYAIISNYLHSIDKNMHKESELMKKHLKNYNKGNL